MVSLRDGSKYSRGMSRKEPSLENYSEKYIYNRIMDDDLWHSSNYSLITNDKWYFYVEDNQNILEGDIYLLMIFIVFLSLSLSFCQ